MSGESKRAVEMSGEQSELLALCRRAYMHGHADPESMGVEMYYPCIQSYHERVVLLSSNHHPEVVAVATFCRDGHPVRFEDRRTGEWFVGFVNRAAG